MTYVRLQHDWQLRAMQVAHQDRGVWVASHYMLPGLAFGMDGQTHVSATTRLGFAYTRSSGGVSYSDMRDLFSLSGMFDISTTFSPVLYSQPESPDAAPPTYIVDDERLKVLKVPRNQPSLITKRKNEVENTQAGPAAIPQTEEPSPTFSINTDRS